MSSLLLEYPYFNVIFSIVTFNPVSPRVAFGLVDGDFHFHNQFTLATGFPSQVHSVQATYLFSVKLVMPAAMCQGHCARS